MSELPHGWQARSLGGLTQPRKTKGIPAENADLPFIGMEHVEGHTGRILETADSRDYVSAAPRVETADVLFGRLRPYLNKVALAPQQCFVSGEFIPLPGTTELDAKFLQYRLLAPDFVGFTAELDKGDRPRVSWPQISTFQLGLPPSDEQRRIVEILDDHFSRLDAAVNLLARLESRSRALWAAATHAATRSVPISMRPLSEVVSRIEAGKSFLCDTRAADPEEWGVIKVSAMTWGEFLPGENKAVRDLTKVDARFEIRDGDVLVSRANTEQYVGAPVIVRSPRVRLLLSDKSLRLVPARGVHGDWLHAVLSAPESRRQISRLATGTKDSMRNISQQALLTVQVPVPHNAEAQTTVVSRAEAATVNSARLVEACASGRRQADALRRSLLHAAFTGQLTKEFRNV